MANFQLIKEIARKKKIPLKELAQKAEISATGLHQLIRNNTANVDTIERIAKVLDVSPAVFFIDKNNETLLEEVNAEQLGYLARESFAEQLAEMFKAGEIHPASTVKALQEEIKELYKKIGRLEAECNRRDKSKQ